MSKQPPIPPEQRAFPGEKPNVAGRGRDRREDKTDLQSSQPGDDEVNLGQQGRQANVRQNTTRQGNVQDR